MPHPPLCRSTRLSPPLVGAPDALSETSPPLPPDLRRSARRYYPVAPPPAVTESSAPPDLRHSARLTPPGATLPELAESSAPHRSARPHPDLLPLHSALLSQAPLDSSTPYSYNQAVSTDTVDTCKQAIDNEH